MNKISKEILKDTENYIIDFFNEHDKGDKLFFHKLSHTQRVVAVTHEIGTAQNLDEESLNLITFCAWFHDTGYFIDVKNHEEESVKLAYQFLKKYDINDEQLEKIRTCIMSTRWPQEPTCRLSKIICDADMNHLASPEYFELAEKLRKEISFTKEHKIKKNHFHMLNCAFLTHHQYFTDYAKDNFTKGKMYNIDLLNEKIEKLGNKEHIKTIEKLNNENSKLKKKLEKASGYSRGVESMFRLTARNQINLSSIADNKSNILITVNTIIISIILSVLLRKLDDSRELILPTLALLTTSLVTIVFAILSTRPNISKGEFTKEDIKENRINLLFFGNFYNMQLDDYEWAIEEMMKNDSHLYSTMIKDQYLLGKVLAKKYKLLRIAYNIFMIGLILSTFLFIISQTGF